MNKTLGPMMRMQGNQMPGQNACTDDAYLLVLKQDCMMVWRGNQRVQRFKPPPVLLRIG